MIFFAEDAFGTQFGVLGEGVVQFDPETATFAEEFATIDAWAAAVSQDPAYYTAAPVLQAWEEEHSQIPTGYRLVPKQLFMFGGEFHSDNMLCKSDVEGLRLRAELWKSTRDIPDGQTIVFKRYD